MNNVNFINSFAKYCKENYKTLSKMIISFQLFLIGAFFIAIRSSMLLVMVFGIAPLILFIVAKDLMDDEEKKKAFVTLRISFILFLTTFINHLVYSLIYVKLNNQLATLNIGTRFNPVSSLGIAGFFNVIVIMLTVFFSRKDTVKDALDNFVKESILEKIGIFVNQSSSRKGDVQICKDLKTGRPVIIPYKDRFLHMLILGPTGSGKTSQIILPMLNQDLQNEEAGVTVIEPKGDLAEKAYAMAQHYGREALYFDPILEGCPTFNPLYGKEEDVIENMVITFKMLNPDSPQYFQDMNEQLMRNALKVLKRLKGNSATLIDLDRLVSNPGGEGRKMVLAFQKLPAPTESLAKENSDIATYFLSDYLADRSKTYENTSGVRSQIAKIVSNKFLRRVLNPENGKSDINFDEILAKGKVICITTDQGKLRDLSRFLGYFLILTLQSSVFKRPGNENTRIPHFLYIDEFQVYSNPGFADMLTQGRSYRVASHLATQNRALIGMGSGKEGEDFKELVSTNARNIILFPGGNYNDAKYYSEQFGQIMEKKERKGVSKAQFNPLFGGGGGKVPTESISISEEMVARFTPTDIIFRPFGEITYLIIKNNSIQDPNVGKVTYIPQDLNTLLDKMVEENQCLMMVGYNPNNCRELKEHGKLKPDVNMDEIREIANAKRAGVFDALTQDVHEKLDNIGGNKNNPSDNSIMYGNSEETSSNANNSEITIDIDEWEDDEL